MRRALAVLALAALAFPACRFHKRGPDQRLKPEGEIIAVGVAGTGRISGELIVVEPDRIVLLDAGRYVAVPLDALRTVEVEGYPSIAANHERAQLALYARYPQGLRPEQWAVLLGQAGQAAPDPPPPPAEPPAAAGKR